MRQHACVEGLTFIIFLTVSTNTNNDVEWALVLPSSFVIHNLGLLLNSSKGSVSPLPIWSCAVTSFNPHSGSFYWQQSKEKNLYIVHSQIFEHLTRGRQRGSEAGDQTEIEESSQRESTMGAQNEGLSSHVDLWDPSVSSVRRMKQTASKLFINLDS